MDPTSGVVALFVIGLLAATHKMMSAGISRDHESQADEMGMILAARACFDTAAGSVVMRKLNEQQGASNINPRIVNGLELFESHPPTQERYDTMLKQSETVNYHNQECCKSVATRLQDAIWRSKSIKPESAKSD
jgi:predicted Zn-dependent protease